MPRYLNTDGEHTDEPLPDGALINDVHRCHPDGGAVLVERTITASDGNVLAAWKAKRRRPAP